MQDSVKVVKLKLSELSEILHESLPIDIVNFEHFFTFAILRWYNAPALIFLNYGDWWNLKSLHCWVDTRERAKSQPAKSKRRARADKILRDQWSRTWSAPRRAGSSVCPDACERELGPWGNPGPVRDKSSVGVPDAQFWKSMNSTCSYGVIRAPHELFVKELALLARV